MTVLSTFELLAENLVPPQFVPGGTDNPFVSQGYFLQISLPGFSGGPISFNLVFQETTDFKVIQQNNSLLSADITNAGGVSNLYPTSQFLQSTSRGFLQQTINPGQSLVYGVQLLPNFGAPPSQIGLHGVVSLNVLSGGTGRLLVCPTHRQVFYNDLGGKLGAPLDGVAYPVPTASGNAII